LTERGRGESQPSITSGGCSTGSNQLGAAGKCPDPRPLLRSRKVDQTSEVGVHHDAITKVAPTAP
jgi:hypothetical protein